MDNTIILQGRFTQSSPAVNQTIVLRSDLDWMRVYNITVAAASQTTAIGVEYYWQRGFPQGAMWEYLKSNAAAAANLSQYITSGGFTLVDSSFTAPGALNNGSTGISALTNATPPVATVGSTAGMAAGSIVRVFNVAGAHSLDGIDFTVGYNTFSATTFDLSYMVAAGVGTSGSFRVIPYDPIYYPRRRTIATISKAVQAVVTTTVTHGYTVGQEVRFVIPAAMGMIELNGLQATIVAVNTSTTVNSFTINIDTTSFTTFAFPASGSGAFTPGEVVPMGEDTAQALSSMVSELSDATINTAYIGITLTAGANSPAGQAGDVIYWVAGKSFSVNNL